MAKSVKSSSVVVGMPLTAFVWEKNGKTEVPVKVLNVQGSDPKTDLVIEMDAFTAKSNGIHMVVEQDGLAKRVTFKTDDDVVTGKPKHFVPSEAKSVATMPRPVLNMEQTPEPPKAIVKRKQSPDIVLPDHNTPYGTQHILEKAGQQTTWTWNRANWEFHHDGKVSYCEPRALAKRGYTYISAK